MIDVIVLNSSVQLISGRVALAKFRLSKKSGRFGRDKERFGLEIAI